MTKKSNQKLKSWGRKLHKLKLLQKGYTLKDLIIWNVSVCWKLGEEKLPPNKISLMWLNCYHWKRIIYLLQKVYSELYRSSHPQHSPSSRLRPATLLKKRRWHRCFPWILRNFWECIFLQNTSSGCFWLYIIWPAYGIILVFSWSYINFMF